MAEQDKGFLGRWSARKVAVNEGKPVTEPPRAALQGSPALPVQQVPIAAQAQQGLEPTAVLTLEDAAALTPASDFSGFVAKGVDTVVKNAAMKKLFADPHFNVMDGLDIYIGDYSTHAPMPQSVIDEITKDGFLNMFHKDKVEEPVQERPDLRAHLHDDADLQLQRDDAAGRESLGGSIERSTQSAAGVGRAQPAVPPSST